MTPDTHEITRSLPDFLRMSTVLAGYGKGGELQGLLQAVQQGELLGMINKPEDLKKLLFLNEFITMRSGGQVGPAQVLQFLRSGGAAAQALSLEELFGSAAPMILSMGAARAGTGLRGFYQQFSAGKQSDAAVSMLNEMGLIRDPATGQPFKEPYWTQGAFGQPQRVMDPQMARYKTGIGQYHFPGDVLTGWEMLHEGRQFEYIEKILLPRIQDYNKKHYGANDVNLESQTGFSLASRITGGNLLADMFRVWPMIQGYRASYAESQRSGSPEKDYDLRLKEDPTLRMQGFHAAWGGFLSSLANSHVMDAATKILQDMTRGLNAVGDWADKNKGTAAVLIAVAEGLGILAIAAAGIAGAAWLGGPMLRTGQAALGIGAGAAAGSAMRGGRGLVGATALGGAAVSELTGAPDWITNGLLGAGLGATVGAGFAGVGAIPGAAAGFVGGALWNARIPWLSDHTITGDRIGAAPTEDRRPVNLTGTVQLDGRQVGTVIANQQISHGTLPLIGPTAGDIRMTIPSSFLGGP